MITVKKINKKEIVVNCELIQTVEGVPDTVIHLTTGDKLIVSDRPEDIVRKVLEYRKAVHCSGLDVYVHPEQDEEQLEAVTE